MIDVEISPFTFEGLKRLSRGGPIHPTWTNVRHNHKTGLIIIQVEDDIFERMNALPGTIDENLRNMISKWNREDKGVIT